MARLIGWDPIACPYRLILRVLSKGDFSFDDKTAVVLGKLATYFHMKLNL
jgi:hypothetical protein